MTRVILEFTRRGHITEVGRCEIEVDNPEDMDEIDAVMEAQEFKRFIINSRTPDDYDWEWEIKEVLNDEAA